MTPQRVRVLFPEKEPPLKCGDLTPSSAPSFLPRRRFGSREEASKVEERTSHTPPLFLGTQVLNYSTELEFPL